MASMISPRYKLSSPRIKISCPLRPCRSLRFAFRTRVKLDLPVFAAFCGYVQEYWAPPPLFSLVALHRPSGRQRLRVCLSMTLLNKFSELFYPFSLKYLREEEKTGHSWSSPPSFSPCDEEHLTSLGADDRRITLLSFLSACYIMLDARSYLILPEPMIGRRSFVPSFAISMVPNQTLNR